MNEKLNKLKKRTSISLPDINSYCDLKDANLLNKSATSTPHKNLLIKQISTPKNNISIILEEKENPNYMLNSDKLLSNMNKSKEAKKLKNVEYKSASIQCNKAEEDMVFADSVEGTSYWRLIAHKRHAAFLASNKENTQVILFG